MGTLGCDLFEILGAISGMGNAVNNVAIQIHCIFVLLVWLWATPFSLKPALEIWNRFIPEGYLATCSFDYLTDS
ncbi:Hypothetical predicted protein [Cloeon dipterum]|uniref:Uncharacterized protein n=1 Tax=Cloeon dipterum TaxID=197152 RepID=A0A8S1CKB3_9INSE|nr:Hypothetical predicted protein [Cloeon dipterum]